MSVEPETEPEAPGPDAPSRRWPVPPPGGWTGDDLDELPNLPPHTELIDASLVFVSPQTLFHSLAVSFFEWQLRSQAPAGILVLREFTIDIDWQNRPEPDVVVCHSKYMRDHEQTRIPAESALLAIEVVSRESRSRDRETKPLKYARAKIPHYWRVENSGNGEAVVHVFELEPATGVYVSTGIFRDWMKVPVPFPVDLDLTTIMPRPDADGA
ncbi:Uma2 family endonuclease [Streptomyces sp. JV176]|uniref:Uma2 family endonuclease n=1 Tax=Streptomyces sp. JV176 TaxID=858630 RepID=UPI002E7750E5|nr:Uma2 family endonuclease [Streptomyces sp. JV176]MEE1803753.1 Uma2 family endonuclease [Streptomyces sp. JV176]